MASKAVQRWRGLQTQNWRESVHLSVKYRGGATVVFLVQARGRHGVFDGMTTLYDVMCEITQQPLPGASARSRRG
jgi:hypothetical protein